MIRPPPMPKEALAMPVIKPRRINVSIYFKWWGGEGERWHLFLPGHFWAEKQRRLRLGCVCRVHQRFFQIAQRRG